MTSDGTAFLGLHHVALPFPGTEADTETARAFYGKLIGLRELQVPESISGVMRFDAGAGTELHLYSEPDGAAMSTPRHPCLRVRGLSDLRERLSRSGAELIEPPVADIPARHRFFAIDPFGNAVEFAEFDF
jgi:catechol 2,3-dioxygenase-like lactoylglutathione lyase family enzyme